MKKRKTPVRHQVKTHIREGKSVGSYMRGHGNPQVVVRRRKLKIRPTEDPSRQAYLETTGFADISIVPYVNQINSFGFKTIASCSGMQKDHPGAAYGDAYLSVELPETVAVPDIGGDIHEVDPRNVKDWVYINKLISAGHNANWHAELRKYLMAFPVVTFRTPKTKSVVMDRIAEKDTRLVKAEEELKRAMGKEDGKIFLKALDVRDKIKNEVYKEHGSYVRSDTELDKDWRRLVIELAKVKGLETRRKK